MSDKMGFIPDEVKNSLGKLTEAVAAESKKVAQETLTQSTGSNPNALKQRERAEELQKRAEKNSRTPEEQAEIDSLRRRLHQEIITPRPKAPEEPRTEQEDQVGTNEGAQQLGDLSGLSSNPSQQGQSPRKKMDTLKIRE